MSGGGAESADQERSLEKKSFNSAARSEVEVPENFSSLINRQFLRYLAARESLPNGAHLARQLLTI